MAGNARFHDKVHRKNHHTLPTVGYPDSGTDPIASYSEPFQGDFVLSGLLSAKTGVRSLSVYATSGMYCENMYVRSVTYTNYISGQGTETIISDGALTGYGDNTMTLDYTKAIYAKTPLFNITNNLSVVNTTYLNKLSVNGTSNLNDVYSNSLNVSGDIYGKNITSTNQGGLNQISYKLIRQGAVSNAKSWELIHFNDTLSGSFGIRTNSDDYATSSNAFIAYRALNSIKVDSVSLWTNDSNRFHINSSGNIGIGTTSKIPTTYNRTLVEIFDNTITGGGLLALGSLSGHSLIYRDEATNSLKIDSDRDYNSSERRNKTDLTLNTGNNINFRYNGTDKVTILSSGKTGINRVDPNTMLHVNGDITIDTGYYLNLHTTSAHTAIKRNTSINGIEFYTNSQPRMFISDNGNVGIGTSTFLHTPTDMLEVSGSVGANSYRSKQGNPNNNNESTGGYTFGDDGDTGMFSPSSVATPVSPNLGIVAFYANSYETSRTFWNAYPIFTIGLSAASQDYSRTTLAIGDNNNGGLIELRDGNLLYSTIYRDSFTNSLWLNGKSNNSGIVLSSVGTGTITLATSGNSTALVVQNDGIVNIPVIKNGYISSLTARSTQSTYVPTSAFNANNDITLSLSSKTYQFIGNITTNRNLFLPAVNLNNDELTFIIKNITDTNPNNYISVKDNSSNELYQLSGGKNIQVIWKSPYWYTLT